MGPSPHDDMAAMLPAGGLIAPTLTNSLAAPRPTGGRPAPDINAVAPVDTAATLPAGDINAVVPVDTAVTLPAGGRRPAPNINAVVPVDTAATLLAGGIDTPDDALRGDNPYFKFGTPARPTGSGGTACLTALETFAMSIEQLPNLEEPVDSFLWRETFMQQARLADKALADFHRELDGRFDTVHGCSPPRLVRRPQGLVP